MVRLMCLSLGDAGVQILISSKEEVALAWATTNNSTPCRGGAICLCPVWACTMTSTLICQHKGGCSYRLQVCNPDLVLQIHIQIFRCIDISISCRWSPIFQPTFKPKTMLMPPSSCISEIPDISIWYLRLSCRWRSCHIWRGHPGVRMGAGAVPRGWYSSMLQRQPTVRKQCYDENGDQMDQLVQAAPGDSNPPHCAHSTS